MSESFLNGKITLHCGDMLAVLPTLAPDYLLLGWLPVADLGHPHAQWSFLCEWLCGCPCVEPHTPSGA